jgi:hypothetical protein
MYTETPTSVGDGQVAGTGEWPHSAKLLPKLSQSTISQSICKKSNQTKSQIQLALQAIERDLTLSLPRAARISKVPERTLSRRRDRTSSQRDCMHNSMKLLKTEEHIIVQHILNLDVRGFPLCLILVKDMADFLLAERHHNPVGQNWAETFVRHWPELKVKFNQKYNYKRILCEDPHVVRD